MARFRATIQGSRGEASRLGHQDLSANIASWQGAVAVYLFRKGDEDWAHVHLTTHHSAGTNRLLYDGPVNGERENESNCIICGREAEQLERPDRQAHLCDNCFQSEQQAH